MKSEWFARAVVVESLDEDFIRRIKQSQSNKDFVEKMDSIRKETESALRLTAETMKRFFNRHRNPAHEYKVGDKVFLEGLNLTTM